MSEIHIDRGAIERAIRERLDRIEAEAQFKWRMKDGREITVDEMSGEHLYNTINYLARRLPNVLSQATWLESVTYYVEALTHMLHEAKDRGLKV